jgi:hypothetical protein
MSLSGTLTDIKRIEYYAGEEPDCHLSFYGPGRNPELLGTIGFWTLIDTVTVVIQVGPEYAMAELQDKEIRDRFRSQLISIVNNVDLFGTALKDLPPELAVTNLGALGRFGKEARRFVPQIEEMADSTDNRVARAARLALRDIRGE